MNLTVFENNTQDSQPERISVVFHWTIRVGAFTTGLLLTAVSILTIHILRKCRKLTTQIRLMSMHLTIGSLLYGISMVCNGTYYIVNGSACRALIKLLPLALTTFSLFLTAAGIDRLLSLKLSFKYTFWNKRRNAYILVTSLYVIAITINLTNIPPNFHLPCTFEIDVFTDIGLVTFVSCNFLLELCDVVVYSYIGIIAIRAKLSSGEKGRHIGIQNDFRSFCQATLKCFALSLITIMLCGPFVITETVALLSGSETLGQGQTSPALIMFFVLHRFISTIFILVSYKECRYHTSLLLCCCCKRKRQKIKRGYKQHYATFMIALSDH